jgi:hypothetical protein
MARPDDLRRKLLGANAQRRRRLEATQRGALDALDTTPDLLSPLGELRYEPSHSRLIARFMEGAQGSALAPKLLAAFLHLLGIGPEEIPDEATSAMVEAERMLPAGRVDISITLPHLLIFVEMKVDAEEGVNQLQRYREALQSAAGKRASTLVYLTLPGAADSASRVAHLHLTLEKLLGAWLPFACGGDGPEGYLARYLKSLAMLLGYCGVGQFDNWSISEQRRALDLVEPIQ